jgi:hypothetical protein
MLAGFYCTNPVVTCPGAAMFPAGAADGNLSLLRDMPGSVRMRVDTLSRASSWRAAGTRPDLAIGAGCLVSR